MKTDRPAHIPIPFQSRLRELRLRWLPPVVLILAFSCLALLWDKHVVAPTMVGQAEPILANVSSYKAGVLAELRVNRFQKVKAGETVGQVMVTDPKILASSLAVIQAEIEMLRAGMA